jgi:hypothetical protein
VKRRLLLGVGGERRRYENRNGRQAAAGGCRRRRLRVVCPRIVWQRIGRGGRLLQCALARSAMRAQPAFAAARPLGATATSLLCRRCGNSTATGVLWPSSAGAVRAFCGRCGLRAGRADIPCARGMIPAVASHHGQGFRRDQHSGQPHENLGGDAIEQSHYGTAFANGGAMPLYGLLPKRSITIDRNLILTLPVSLSRVNDNVAKPGSSGFRCELVILSAAKDLRCP